MSDYEEDFDDDLNDRVPAKKGGKAKPAPKGRKPVVAKRKELPSGAKTVRASQKGAKPISNKPPPGEPTIKTKRS